MLNHYSALLVMLNKYTYSICTQRTMHFKYLQQQVYGHSKKHDEVRSLFFLTSPLNDEVEEKVVLFKTPSKSPLLLSSVYSHMSIRCYCSCDTRYHCFPSLQTEPENFQPFRQRQTEALSKCLLLGAVEFKLALSIIVI